MPRSSSKLLVLMMDLSYLLSGKGTACGIHLQGYCTTFYLNCNAFSLPIGEKAVNYWEMSPFSDNFKNFWTKILDCFRLSAPETNFSRKVGTFALARNCTLER